MTEEKKICVYCKINEAKNNWTPACCGSEECVKKWNDDRLSWEADCMSERQWEDSL